MPEKEKEKGTGKSILTSPREPRRNISVPAIVIFIAGDDNGFRYKRWLEGNKVISGLQVNTSSLCWAINLNDKAKMEVRRRRRSWGLTLKGPWFPSSSSRMNPSAKLDGWECQAMVTLLFSDTHSSGIRVGGSGAVRKRKNDAMNQLGFR